MGLLYRLLVMNGTEFLLRHPDKEERIQVAGEQGLQGDTGEQGATGPQGPKGLTGDSFPAPVSPSDSQRLLPTGPVQVQDVIQQQSANADYLILRFAVIGLITAALVTIIGTLILAWQSIPLPDGILAIGSASVGALATLLVRPPGRISI